MDEINVLSLTLVCKVVASWYTKYFRGVQCKGYFSVARIVQLFVI